MKNLYLYHYTGGMCGDFICLEVSKDENYYSNMLLKQTKDNRYLGENPLAKFGLDYKETLTVCSNELYKKIDEEFQDYNLIIPAHTLKRNLPRLKVIRSYVQDKKYVPMFFMLLYIKAWSTKRVLSDNEDTLLPLGSLHTSHQQFNFMKERFKNYRPAKGLIEHIEERGYYYNFELRALESNRLHVGVINGHFPIYEHRLRQHFPADIQIAIDQLLLNPNKHAVEFSKQIDMAQPLNIERLETYHQANLDVVERTFNKTYHKLIQGNWLDELQEYIDQICPNNYFSQTIQQP